MKKALITGITGQDGSYLAELLLEKGYEVHGIIRRASVSTTARIDHIMDKITIHEGDLSDSSSIIRIVLQVKPDEIYNLAAQSHVQVSFDAAEYTGDVDDLGVLRILEAVHIAGLEKTCRIYQASTSELYGKVEECPQSETIHIAHEAFQFIRENKNCLVLIGDFTGFFDSLDHQYLKQQWCKVMGFDFLPQDHYAVFKNVTKYSMWELDDLLSITGLSQKEFNKRRLALSKEEYRNNRSHISRNNKTKQIPQGSPISAVLANIYMINADKEIHDYVKALGGMYMRYSDDFIVIVPANRSEIACFKNVLSILKGIPNLELEPSKTQIFAVAESRVENIGRDLLEKADVSKKVINFLGFTFDGQSVSVRSKTISKYYYRMYRKAKSISKNPTLSGADNLYKSYSIHGAKAKPGNFFTYINHAKEVFGEDELIDRDLKNHIPKIRKALKGKK